MGEEVDVAAVRQSLAAARLWAANRFPYLAQALFAQTVALRPGSGVFGVDAGWRLYVDPEVVSSMDVPALGTALVHHTGHLLRDHAERAHEQAVDQSASATWLRAADAEINDDLVAAGLLPRDSPDLPSAFGAEPGGLAEEYFGLLQEPADAPPDGLDGHDDGSEEGPAAGGNDCGSGAHGVERTWEDAAGTEPGLSEISSQLLRRAVADEIVKQAGREPGSVPAGLARWAATMLRPKVDWRRALGAEVRRGLADAAGRVDYSYRRPSRRPGNGVVLPSLRHPTPEIAVVVDTSGSMHEALLGQALAEVDGIARRAGLHGAVRVLAVDTDVHAVSKARRGADVRLAGGGGTDMGRGIDAAERLRPRPQVVVVLTDGFTPWPASPPRAIRVVVALLGGAGAAAGVPPWARLVVVDDL